MYIVVCRYKKKDQSPNVGGLGLGFKEKAQRPQTGCSSTRTPSLPSMQQQSPARGPATDRLSAMKAAFRAQYQTQVCIYGALQYV